MTDADKRRVQDMRRQGCTCSQIADALGVSVNTVKSFCRRNSLSPGDASNDTGIEENKDTCKQCGKKLNQTPNAKPKAFCDDRCRHKWWNAHRDRMKRQAVHRKPCACCGTVFDSYGSRNRKYCCHACYIKDRYGKGAGLP